MIERVEEVRAEAQIPPVLNYEDLNSADAKIELLCKGSVQTRDERLKCRRRDRKVPRVVRFRR